jgi:hypothetical protein
MVKFITLKFQLFVLSFRTFRSFQLSASLFVIKYYGNSFNYRRHRLNWYGAF